MVIQCFHGAPIYQTGIISDVIIGAVKRGFASERTASRVLCSCAWPACDRSAFYFSVFFCFASVLLLIIIQSRTVAFYLYPH